MITSTTELLNEIAEVSSQSETESRIFPRSSHISAASIKLKKEFAVRYDCMQAWFLRCSWLDKMESLVTLLGSINNTECLSLILNTLKMSASKATVYAEAQPSTNFVYDKTLHDHCRSLHYGEFLETRKSDIEWFKTIEDSEQILIIIGLIRLGGGSVVHQIYKRGVEIYNERIQGINKVKTAPDIIEIKSPTPRTFTSELQFEKTKVAPSSDSQLPVDKPRPLNIKPDNVARFEKDNPNDPYVIEVQRKRKAWNEVISKYRMQVEGNQPKISSASAKGKKEDKSAKSSASKSPSKSIKSKSSKSAKSSKSSKSSKGGKKKKENEELDRVQLLPIWIVKQIFSYLDTKTLKKVQDVNKYWAFAVDDYTKELKARKTLDKVIFKMEEDLEKSKSQLQMSIIENAPKTLKEVRDASSPKKRLVKLSERGATLPKIVGKLKRPLNNNSLLADAAKQEAECFLLPVENLTCFPRYSALAAPLYKVRSCMVNELGFNKVDFDDGFEELSIGTFVSTTMRFASKCDNVPRKEGIQQSVMGKTLKEE